MLDVNAVGKKLEIKRDNSGVVRVEGASVKDAANAAELRALLDTGLANRRTAETKMNTQSSRSHLIFSILVQNHVPATNTTTSGKITFVDLAGSERVARSGALNDNERLKEAAAINKSLSALGDVVSALTEGAAFVPYRNHKLTQLMADSLGGNAKCCMIVNVSPLAVDADETKSSLDYATRVKLVTNEASKSMETREIAKLKAEIAKLKGR
jgi:kinesin family protein C2/C3